MNITFANLTEQIAEAMLNKMNLHALNLLQPEPEPMSNPTQPMPQVGTPKENPVMPPTPAERLSIHKVKNGWTLDVDYAATRQFGDTYASPGYVYTTLTRLASDVMTLLRCGKPADHGGRVGLEEVVVAIRSQDELRRLKQEAYVAGRDSRNEERDEEVAGWRKSSDKLNSVVQELCEANDRLNDNCNGLRQANVIAIKERNEAVDLANQCLSQRDVARTERDIARREKDGAYAMGKQDGAKEEHDRWTAEAGVKALRLRIQELTNDVISAYTSGYKSGVAAIMKRVKDISAEICGTMIGGSK